MTQDEIIRMALEAGFDVDEGLFPFEATEDKYIGTSYNLERFAAIVSEAAVLAEREACAKVCEERQRFGIDKDGYMIDCAAAIRARSEE